MDITLEIKLLFGFSLQSGRGGPKKFYCFFSLRGVGVPHVQKPRGSKKLSNFIKLFFMNLLFLFHVILLFFGLLLLLVWAMER